MPIIIIIDIKGHIRILQVAYEHDRRKIIFKEKQNSFRLWIAEAHVIFQDLRTRLGEDEARKQQANEGKAC